MAKLAEVITKEVAIARLREALLTDSFQYPKTYDEKKLAADRIQETLNVHREIITYEDIFVIRQRCGNTIYKMAELTDNELATFVFDHSEPALNFIKKTNEMGSAAYQKILEKKQEKEKRKESCTAPLQVLALELKTNSEKRIEEVVKAFAKATVVYLQNLKEKSDINKKLIEDRFTKIFETALLNCDKNTSGFFSKYIAKTLEGTCRLMDIYPAVRQYMQLMKKRKKKLPKLLSDLPGPVKTETENALGLNNTHEIILRLNQLLERYDPQFCVAYKVYLNDKSKFDDIEPPALCMLGHPAFQQINEAYFKKLHDYIDAQFALIDKKMSDLLKGSRNGIHKEDLLPFIQTIFDNGNWSDRKNTPYGFALVNDAYNFAEMMIDGFNNVIDMVAKSISDNKVSPVTILQASITSFIEHMSHEQVAAQDRKVGKAIEGKRREEAARSRAVEEKRAADTQAHMLEAARRASNLKDERAVLLKAVGNLNKDEQATLAKILREGRGLHNLLETQTFCDIAEKIPPFSIKKPKPSSHVYELFYNKQFVCSFHRQHGGKKLDGSVLAEFIKKIDELDLKSTILEQIDADLKKPASAAGAAATRSAK